MTSSDSTQVRVRGEFHTGLHPVVVQAAANLDDAETMMRMIV
jgi:hypothetical protein